MTFQDRLLLSITLEAAGATHTISGGEVKDFALDVQAHGFSGTFEWWLVSQASASEDDLFAFFVKPDLITATIRVKRAFDEVGETATELVVVGLVGAKSVVERAFPDLASAPVLHRRYRIEVADRAAHLWGRHFPVTLHADATVQAMIDAELPSGMTLTHTWSAASKTHPIQALGLGVGDAAASFYDFLGWLLDQENAGLFFDPAAGTYEIRDTKPAASDPVAIPVDDVADLSVHLPATRREAVAVLNAYAEAGTKKSDVANDAGVTGIRRDYLAKTPIEGEVTSRVTLETNRLVQREPELVIAYKRYPALATRPNLAYDFSDDEWSAAVFQKDVTYRMRRLEIVGRAVVPEATADQGEATNEYHLDATATLETSTDPVFLRPPHGRPAHPFLVEGHVVSEVGGDAEKTYQVYTDSATSRDLYHVKLPLFDATIVAPFDAGHLSGQYYFPLDKGRRVLVALDHRAAAIVEVLEWRLGARLPGESQGQQLLFGKQASDQTAVIQAYEDGKPKLTISRTKDTDTELIQISDGDLLIRTKDDGA